MRHLVISAVAVFAMAFFFSACNDSNNNISGISESDPVTGSAPSSKTAQSVMIDIQGGGNFVINGSETWNYNTTCARTYFSVTGGNAGQQNAALNQAANQNKCTFWDGGTLTGLNGPGGTVVIPNAPGTVAPQTCWTLVSSTGGSDVEVCLNITIAGESFVLNKNVQPNGKYSFTMLNSDNTSRISNLTVTLSGDATQVDYPAHTIVAGDAGTNDCLLDFEYTGNAGTFGNTTYLQDGTMGDILNSDSFAPNNAGCPHTAIAEVAPICYTLGAGNYTVTVEASVKGNDGNANVTVSGTSTITIDAQGCEN